MFCMKILLILLKFHEKTLSHSGDINFFLSRNGDMHVASPRFMDKVFDMGGNIPGGNFLGEFGGWEFFGLEFSRGGSS